MVIEKLENVNKSKPQVGERVQQARCACKGSWLLRLFGVVVGPLRGAAYLEEAVFSGSGRALLFVCLLSTDSLGHWPTEK